LISRGHQDPDPRLPLGCPKSRRPTVRWLRPAWLQRLQAEHGLRLRHAGPPRAAPAATELTPASTDGSRLRHPQSAITRAPSRAPARRCKGGDQVKR
jgi:hypothetical protein